MSDANFNQQEESEKRMFEEDIKQEEKNLVEAEKGLRILRLPFKADEISKLPKPTKAQTDAVKANYKAGIRCTVCGSWHHPDVIHLDYVGHAALTDRLLDADLFWSWEPMAYTEEGLPRFDVTGGLWIQLTVRGVARLGYGNAENKSSSDAGAREKEVIGDALRNAAMRFGAALDLWHKGKTPLYEDEPEEPKGNGLKILPRDGCFDDQTPEMKKKMTFMAEKIMELVSQGDVINAVGILTGNGLDNMQIAGVADKLDSKTRAAVKKVMLEQNKTKRDKIAELRDAQPPSIMEDVPQ